MEHAALLTWCSARSALAEPVTVCRVAPTTTTPDGRGDPAAFETEREIYARGYRWCECYTAVCADGERGHFQEVRLLPLSPAEFDSARRAHAAVDDLVLERWLTYRLDAVRHELPDPQAATSNLSAYSLGSPDSRTWAATDSAS